MILWSNICREKQDKCTNDKSSISRSVPTALSLLYLAHKYMLTELVAPVLNYIVHNINPDTVLPVLQTFLLYYR